MQVAKLTVSVQVISSGMKEVLQYSNHPYERQGVAQEAQSVLIVTMIFKRSVAREITSRESYRLPSIRFSLLVLFK